MSDTPSDDPGRSTETEAVERLRRVLLDPAPLQNRDFDTETWQDIDSTIIAVHEAIAAHDTRRLDRQVKRLGAIVQREEFSKRVVHDEPADSLPAGAQPAVAERIVSLALQIGLGRRT